jgi:hypothetical protein
VSDIIFNLTNSANLNGMAPAPAMGGGFGNAALPAAMNGYGAGTYIIVNTLTNNRYIGIASDIANRFNTRLATVTEMGFGAATMSAIGVCWGQTNYRISPTLLVPAPPWVVAVPAPPGAFQVMIDGAAINLERLLIRFCINQLGAGGTVSNNAMAATPYVNPTPNPVAVQLHWGTMGGLFPAGNLMAVWAVGAGW